MTETITELHRNIETYQRDLAQQIISREPAPELQQQLSRLIWCIDRNYVGRLIKSDKEKIADLIQLTCKNVVDESVLSHLCNSFIQFHGNGGTSVYQGWSGYNPSLIIKSNHEHEEITIHEFIVGTELNKLSGLCHYFPYTFSLIDCEFLPVRNFYVAESGRSVVLESVPGTIMAREKLSGQQIRNILLQIESALNLAYQRCHFTHNDLHTKNILVEYHTPAVTVPIFTNNETWYLKTDVTIKIIDFGMSFVQVNGEPCGYTSSDLSPISLYCDRGYPMYDTYKFICCLGAVWKSNNEIYSLAQKIFQEFFNEDLDQRLDRYHAKREQYYGKKDFPEIEKDFCHCDDRYLNVTHQQFIDYLLKEFHYEFTDTPSETVSPHDWCDFFDILLKENNTISSYQYQWLLDHDFPVAGISTSHLSSQESYNIINMLDKLDSFMELKVNTRVEKYILKQHEKIKKWLQLVDFDCNHTIRVEQAYNRSLIKFERWRKPN